MRLYQTLGLVAAVLLSACGVREPNLTYEKGVIRAEGRTGPEPAEGWESVLSIRAGDDPSAPTLLGDYKESGGVITFTPRFPPSPGVRLHVSFSPGAGKPELTAEFGEAAKAIVPTTKVTRIYPSADEWPANTLRMYVEFSAPMAAGEAYSHMRVLDDQGRVVEGPFVEIDPELWDPTGTRLTLLFDPGRIKRGLVDNESSGPPLMPGRTVTLEVDPSWRDAKGAPLADRFTRTIRVTDSLRKPVDVNAWRVNSPRADDALMIHFDRPLDHAIARRAISVLREGSPVAGRISLEKNEMLFRFTPDAPWAPGRFTIRVDGVIEDLAGNRLGKVFDVDTSDPTQSTTATPSAEFWFEVPAS